MNSQPDRSPFGGPSHPMVAPVRRRKGRTGGQSGVSVASLQSLTLHHRNTLLASNVYDLRFHDGGPQRFDQALRRRLVDAILG